MNLGAAVTDAPPPGRPGAEHLLLLRRLRRLLLRAHTAQLLYLWGDDPRSLAWLQLELDRTLRARSRRLLALPALEGLADGQATVELALQSVLQPAAGTELFGVWIDLGDGRAAHRRDWLLARLNERRAGLLALGRPVLLVGRRDAELAVAMLAPDLWSIRSASFGVPAWPMDADIGPPTAARWAFDGDPAAPARMPQVALWDRALAAFDKAVRGQSAADEQSPFDLALDAGFAAFDEAMRHRQLDLAERILGQTAQHLPAAQRDADGWALRWQMRQHGAAGNLAVAHGRLQEAEAAYGRMAQLSERLVKLTGESPESLRDWSVSLNKVGDVQRALGDVAGARERYEESLKVRERLVKLTGESPQALRDWSVSLNKVGEVQRALGDVAGARERFEESLKVSERLVKLTGESPEALRDLAIALQNLGDWSQAHGEAGAARGFFERDLQAAQAALRQSALSQDIQDVVRYAQARLASLPPKLP